MSKNTKFFCIIILAVSVVALVFFRNRSGSFLPYFLILLCPLMHIFMMGGHKEHRPECEEDKKKDG